jgi:hypothetical protein
MGGKEAHPAIGAIAGVDGRQDEHSDLPAPGADCNADTALTGLRPAYFRELSTHLPEFAAAG